MIPIETLTDSELQRLRIACAYLFSPDLAGDDGFLRQLNSAAVEKAFREKTQRYDPALHAGEPPHMLKRRRERLVKIRESYQALKLHVPSEPKGVGRSGSARARIIAVGGAKGGTGKSILAANLGVLLSSRGRRTVLVDLDLGGANLHLYLGENSLLYNTNDFLNKKVATLDEITISTRHGPHLIGGSSSELGAANIYFARKLKLLRAVKKIAADDIILDLGGDTSYNVIDFFLAADHGLVLTTSDPASYLDAYSFIKVALFRKLDRMFGPESEFRAAKDPDLKHLINVTLSSTNGVKGKVIEKLMQKIKDELPGHPPLMQQLVDSFYPQVVGNKVNGQSAIADVVKRIQDVSRKMLSIQVGFLGNIPYQAEIEQSAHDLVPAVVRQPQGTFSNCLTKIVNQF